jgi:glycosyltransferase involved in cell wall biosynthesis
MACAKPVVASPFGMNCEVVKQGQNQNGFLADGEASWYEALLALSQDKNLRDKMGSNGHEKVQKKYSLQATQKNLHTILQEAASCVA